MTTDSKKILSPTLRRVVCSSPQWHLSGVNTFTGNLFRSLQDRGCATEIILTENEPGPAPFPLPDKIPVHELPYTRWGAIRQRHQFLRNRLVLNAPCIYFPNYDFNHLPVIEVLPPEVKVVLIAHSDEDDYYSAIGRYGHAANAIVAVSKSIEGNLRRRHPEWSAKVVRIPYGVSIPNVNPRGKGIIREEAHRARPDATRRIHVVYAGRLSQNQKRIFDLVEVILRCQRQGVPVRFSLAGSGSDEDEVRRRLQPAMDDGTAILEGTLPSKEMNALFARADVVILTSDFEGLPLTLLEAMARGCVPVVTRIASGIDEVVHEGETGVTVAIGDIEAFVDALANLGRDFRKVRAMGEAAADTIRNGPFNIEQTADAYLSLVQNCSARDLDVVRRTGRPVVPIHYSWTYRLRNRLKVLQIPAKTSLPSTPQ